MSDIAVIALVVIAFILYSSWKKKNTSDALGVELSNLEKNLKILKQDVKLLEDINKNISTEFAEAKRYNNYIHLTRQHHLFDVMDEFLKQGSNLKDET